LAQLMPFDRQNRGGDKKYGYKAGKGLGPHATLGLQYALMALSAAKNYREYWLKDIELGRIN